MDKELEKRVEERASWFKSLMFLEEDCEYLDTQTLIWETEARIDESSMVAESSERLNQLQSELKMLKGE